MRLGAEGDAFFKGQAPARTARRAIVKRFDARAMRAQMPAQMRCARLASGAIAQKKQGSATFGRAQAEAAAGGEIECIGHRANIGNDARNRPAGQRFLGDPEQLAHLLCPHDDQARRIEAGGQKARPIGQAEKLSVPLQLQIEYGHAPGRQQGLRLSQGEAEAGAAIAHRIGKDLLDEPACEARKPGFSAPGCLHAHFGQGRLALDIGNDIAQRGKALLAIGDLHGETVVRTKQEHGDSESAKSRVPFVACGWLMVWPCCISPGQERVSEAGEH